MVGLNSPATLSLTEFGSCVVLRPFTLGKKVGHCAEVRTIVVCRKSIMEMTICAEALIGVRSIVNYKNRSVQKESWCCTVFSSKTLCCWQCKYMGAQKIVGIW